MSFISNLCLRIAIAILVQQKIFECSEQCNCKCDFRKDICDEIETLNTKATFKEEQWKIWIPYLETWIEKVKSIENKIKTIEDLEEKLSEAKSRADSLQNAEENTRNQLEVWIEKVNSLENKIKSIEGSEERIIKSESSDESLKTAQENTRNHLEEELLLNISKKVSEVNRQNEQLRNDFEIRMLNVERDTKVLNSDIEEMKIAWKTSEENVKQLTNTDTALQSSVSNMKRKLIRLERNTRNLQRNIKREKQAKTEIKEELLLTTSTKFSDISKQNEQLQKDIETRMLSMEHHINLSKSDVEKIKFALDTSETNISSIEERMPIDENQTNSFQPTTEAAKQVRDEMEREICLKTNKMISEVNRQYGQLKNDIERRVSFLERDSKHLESEIEGMQFAWNASEREIYLKTSKKISKVNRQYERLNNDIKTRIMFMEREKMILESEIEGIKFALSTTQVKLQADVSVSPSVQQDLETCKKLFFHVEELRKLGLQFTCEKIP